MLSPLKLGLDASVVLLFLWAAVVASDFSGPGRWFPQMAAVWGLGLALLNLGMDALRLRRARAAGVGAHAATGRGAATGKGPATGKGAGGKEALSQAEFLKAGYWLLWIVAYGLTIALLGVFVGSALWLLAFFRLAAGISWRFAVIGILAVLAGVYFYGEVMNLRWPSSVFF